MSNHETVKHFSEVKVSSNRSFGIVFSVFFLICSLYPLKTGSKINIYFLSISGVLLVISLIYPKVLKPLNLLWFKIGESLQKIISPLILGSLFFIIMTPIGLLMKLLKKDLLNISLDENAESYWIHRLPPGPESESFKNQF